MKRWKKRKRKGISIKQFVAVMSLCAGVLTGVLIFSIFNAAQSGGSGIAIIEAIKNFGLYQKSEAYIRAENVEPTTKQQTVTAEQEETAQMEHNSDNIGNTAEGEFAAEQEQQAYIQINSATESDERSKVIDITRLGNLSADSIKGMIEEYSFPASCEFLAGVPVTQKASSQILSRRNLDNTADWSQNSYGIVVSNAAVRSFPTWLKISKTTDEDAFDYFQESMFLTGEAVAVLHQTADHIWSFVQGTNYRGWVETDHIAFCSQDDVKAWEDIDSTAVVTDRYLEAGDLVLRMGTVLPAEKTDDGVALSMPKRDKDGRFITEETVIPEGNGLKMGYLSLTQDNIMKQAALLIGIPYGWGDTNMYMDCSSTMNSIYRCFGIILPRNTSEMMYTGTAVTDLTAMSAEEKRSVITAMKPGTLLIMNGHVVMYIGESDGKESILHNVVGFSLDGGKTMLDAYKCCITPLDVTSSSGVSYLERYTHAVSFSEWYQQN